MQNQVEIIGMSGIRTWFPGPKVWQYHNTSTPKTRWSKHDFIEKCTDRIAKKKQQIAARQAELQNLRYKNRSKRASLRQQIQYLEDSIVNLQKIIDMQDGPEHLRAYNVKACNYPKEF